MHPGDELGLALRHGAQLFWAAVAATAVMAAIVARRGTRQRAELARDADALTEVGPGPVFVEGVLRGPSDCVCPSGRSVLAWTLGCRSHEDAGLPRARASRLVLEVDSRAIELDGAVEVEAGSRERMSLLPLGWQRLGWLRQLRRRHPHAAKLWPVCRTVSDGDRVRVRGCIVHAAAESRAYRDGASELRLQPHDTLITMAFVGPRRVRGPWPTLRATMLASVTMLAVAGVAGEVGLVFAAPSLRSPSPAPWSEALAAVGPTSRTRLLVSLDRRSSHHSCRWRMAYHDYRGRPCDVVALGLAHLNDGPMDELTLRSLELCGGWLASARYTRDALEQGAVDQANTIAAAFRSAEPGRRPSWSSATQWPLELLSAADVESVPPPPTDPEPPRLESWPQAADAQVRGWTRFLGCAAVYLDAPAEDRTAAIEAYLEDTVLPPFAAPTNRDEAGRPHVTHFDEPCHLLAEVSRAPRMLRVGGNSGLSMLIAFGTNLALPQDLLHHLPLPEPSSLLPGHSARAWLAHPVEERRVMAWLERPAVRQLLARRAAGSDLARGLRYVAAVRAMLAERAALFDAMTGHLGASDAWSRRAQVWWREAEDTAAGHAALDRAAALHLRVRDRVGALSWTHEAQDPRFTDLPELAPLEHRCRGRAADLRPEPHLDPREQLERAARRHQRLAGAGCTSDQRLLDALRAAWLTPDIGDLLAVAPRLHSRLGAHY